MLPQLVTLMQSSDKKEQTNAAQIELQREIYQTLAISIHFDKYLT